MQPYYGQQFNNQILENIPSTFFVTGVPQRLPFPLAFPVSPGMQGNAEFVVGFLIDSLQRLCNYDVAWKNLFWILYGNGNGGPYNTQYFWESACAAVDLAETYVYMDRMPVQQAAQEAAGIVLGGRAAEFINNNPGLIQQLTPEQQNGLARAAMNFNNAKQRVNMFKNTQQQPQYGGGYPGGGGYPMNNGVRVGGGYGAPRMAYDAIPYGGAPMQLFQPAAPVRAPVGIPHRQPDPNNMMNMSATQLRPHSERMREVDEQQPVQMKQHIVEEVTMEAAPQQQATVVMEPTEKSNLKLTFSPRGNFHQVFDPTTHMSMLVNEDGNVIEKIVSLEELGLDYNEHETEQYFKSPNIVKEDKLSKDIARAKKAFDDVVAQKNLSARLEEHRMLNGLEESQYSFTGASYIKKPIVINRGVDPVLALEQYLFNTTDLEDDGGQGAVITFNVFEMDSVVIGDDEAVKYSQLSNCVNYSVLKDRVLELRDYMSRVRWNRLNEDLTQGVNDFLKYNMGINLSIESFVNDIDDLPAYLNKKFKSIRVVDVFNNSVKTIAKTCCYCSTNKDAEFAEAYVVDKPKEGEEAELKLKICAARVSNITTLPIESIDLNIKYNGPVALVQDTDQTKELYNAIKAIFDRQFDLKTIPRYTYMVTLDGVKLHLYEAALGDGYLMRIE